MHAVRTTREFPFCTGRTDSLKLTDWRRIHAHQKRVSQTNKTTKVSGFERCPGDPLNRGVSKGGEVLSIGDRPLRGSAFGCVLSSSEA